MSEPESASKQEPTQASEEAYANASDGSDVNADDDGVETPMLAVWLSLGVILLAGLYGVYLGTSNKAKSTPKASPTSLLVPAQGVAQGSLTERLLDGRLS
ncbi:MAG TPA: hypothetical protein VKP30_03450 [Polyangiaceae bacterium]|nr:hypothetical protein [Polyangiaceae bacterium]